MSTDPTLPSPPPADNGNVVSEVDPRTVHRIHLVGVGGTGMGAFAGMLKAAGYQVTGSDEKVYPPMSDMLRAWGIDVMTPYSPENLDRAKPDLVIIGNVIRRVNPEATAVRERRLRQMSFPAAMGSLILGDKHSIVVTGTHGKTTTSALMAHVLVAAGTDPAFLVGGVTLNEDANYRVGFGNFVVVEGDEYDTAYFDKGPKFLHYRPRTTIVTSIEFDHADIYRDLEHYQSAFTRLARIVPANGMLLVSSTYPSAVALIRGAATAPVTTYSAEVAADWTARDVRFRPEGTHFIVRGPDGSTHDVLLPMSGMHNVENAVGVYAAAISLGLTPAQIADGFRSFKGVKRRQEIRGEIDGVMVIDDFAHHPTAVRETIHGIRLRYPDRRLWAVFEPRSNTSRRNIHQEAYALAFDGAARVSLRIPQPHDQVPANEQLSIPRVVEALRGRGIEADAAGEVSTLVNRVASDAREGDLVLVMSNGAFDGFIPSLLTALRARATRSS
ncbi:MAG TPA: UDP-N-acetylmuramate--L-alanine ligase [Gemmatimonadaceae bacterium]|nr:UDP-N-acetylmuramate--L-alanine ligase [Gemmatimonadaceae bacterium]